MCRVLVSCSCFLSLFCESSRPDPPLSNAGRKWSFYCSQCATIKHRWQEVAAGGWLVDALLTPEPLVSTYMCDWVNVRVLKIPYLQQMQFIPVFFPNRTQQLREEGRYPGRWVPAGGGLCSSQRNTARIQVVPQHRPVWPRYQPTTRPPERLAARVRDRKSFKEV